MQYSEELIKIIKNKNFKTFWHCVDYLSIAGYPILDAFGIALQEFGESRIFSDVAFIKVNNKTIFNDNPYERQSSRRTITIGIIDETNIHLSGLYKMYRTWLVNDERTKNTDIEETCDVININSLSDFLLEYLVEVSKLHYGFEAFKFEKSSDLAQLEPLRQEIDNMRRIAEQMRHRPDFDPNNLYNEPNRR